MCVADDIVNTRQGNELPGYIITDMCIFTLMGEMRDVVKRDKPTVTGYSFYSKLSR